MTTASPEQITKLIADLEAKAYQRGWREATAAIMLAAGKLATPGQIATPAAASVAPKVGKRSRRRKTGHRETYPEAVSRAVTTQPGMGAVAIVRWLNETGYPANEGAVRTALRRLKDTRLEKRDDGWYPKGSAKEAA